MRTMPVDLAVTLFSGYLQNGYSQTSGLIAVDNHARQVCSGRPNVRVSLHPWNVNESDVAETLWRLRPHGRPQCHVVIGYSYGGDRAVKFCRELSERGDVSVVSLILIDPVVRWDRLPGVAAFIGLGKHHVPAFVESVTVFAQQSPRFKWEHGRDFFEPRAHPVVHGGATVETHYLPATHNYIDNAQAVLDACVSSVSDALARVDQLAA